MLVQAVNALASQRMIFQPVIQPSKPSFGKRVKLCESKVPGTPLLEILMWKIYATTCQHLPLHRAPRALARGAPHGWKLGHELTHHIKCGNTNSLNIGVL